MKCSSLTIITVTKDDSDGLKRTLASAAGMRGLGVEHVVVDGSSDTTINQELVKSHDGQLSFHVRTAKGVADAFNAGVRAATGDWVWFLNSGDCIDDRLPPQFLLTLLSHSRADVVIGGLTYGHEAEPRPHYPLVKQWPPVAPWIPHPASLVRRSLFERFGLFDERYVIGMDYEWWLRALISDTRVDIIAVPFTRFALGGMSQRADLQPIVRSEVADARRRHQKALWSNWFLRGASLVKVWISAQLTARTAKRTI